RATRAGRARLEVAAARAPAAAARAPPTERGDALGRFFYWCGFVVRDALGARDERRLQMLLDRLLRDHALGDVTSRRQLEHHVEQRGLDDRAQAARTGFPLERLVGDLP